jgi:hypothetical protein
MMPLAEKSEILRAEGEVALSKKMKKPLRLPGPYATGRTVLLKSVNPVLLVSKMMTRNDSKLMSTSRLLAAKNLTHIETNLRAHTIDLASRTSTAPQLQEAMR